MMQWLLLLSAVLLIAATQAHADPAAPGPALTGKLVEYIQPTGPVDAVFIPDLGLSASPSGTGGEMGDALREFTDPSGAMSALEQVKLKQGFTGGRVFAGFTYETDGPFAGKLNLLCGVSPTESKDWDTIREKMADFRGSQDGGILYKMFKVSSRAERVRAIARCLSQFPGMPRLKPSARVLKAVYIDELSYRRAEHWFRKKDANSIQGSSEQYRQAFRCLVENVAREIPEAAGDVAVAVRTMKYEEETDKPVHIRGPLGFEFDDTVEQFFTHHMTTLSILSPGAVKAQYSVGDPGEVGGLWPSTLGVNGVIVDGMPDAISQILRKSISHLAECRRKAGLFELPTATVQVSGAPAGCPQH